MEVKLDSQQQAVVCSDARNIIVAAGAGSGKTRVLIERVKYLLSKGVSPENIVAITFTNMAADEMHERLVDVPGVGDMFVGTIHSFANRIYKTSGCVYDIYTSDKESLLMGELLYRFGKYATFDDYSKFADLRQQIDKGNYDESILESSFARSTLYELRILLGMSVSMSELSEAEMADSIEALHKLYPHNIHTLRKKYHIISFDELLEKCKEYYAEINGTIEYLLVDEFQDVGNVESSFLLGLSAEHNFFVGDDFQSLYGFKGGNVKIFLSLMKNPDWTSYVLENNYRNGKEILTVANQVIHQCSDILDKKTVCKSNIKGTVRISSKYRLTDELNKLKELGDYSDWFILVRTNKDLAYMEETLFKLGIPAVFFRKSETNLQQMEVDLKSNCVKLLTVHTSKGLESTNVLLYGNFPVIQKSYMRNNDERKVMYVGCTRAKENLIILN